MNRNIKGKGIVCLTAAIFVLFGVSFNLSAHRVNVFAEPIGDTITVDCYYSNGDKVQQGEITVIEDKSETALFSGETDKTGKLIFKIPKKAIANKSGINVVLNAGMGHRGEWNISCKELEESLQASEQSNEIKEKNIRKNEETAIKKSEVKPVQIVIGLAAIFIVFGAFYFIKKVKRKKD